MVTGEFMDLMPLLLLAAVGVVAGVLNVLAGGGSFLTLPVLIFLGLPSTVANATNRVGVLAQSMSAIWGFNRAGVLDWHWALTASVPAVIGAGFGTWAAFLVSDEAFRRILSIVMIVITMTTLFAPEPRPHAGSPRAWPVIIGFFFVGVYGGFLQAGVGFLVLAITSWSGLDLVRGNAIKMLSVALLTVLALLIFAWAAVIDWPMGLALGAGNLLGGHLGVKLAVLRGHRFIKIVVAVTVVALAIRLWLTS